MIGTTTMAESKSVFWARGESYGNPNLEFIPVFPGFGGEKKGGKEPWPNRVFLLHAAAPLSLLVKKSRSDSKQPICHFH